MMIETIYKIEIDPNFNDEEFKAFLDIDTMAGLEIDHATFAWCYIIMVDNEYSSIIEAEDDEKKLILAIADFKKHVAEKNG